MKPTSPLLLDWPRRGGGEGRKADHHKSRVFLARTAAVGMPRKEGEGAGGTTSCNVCKIVSICLYQPDMFNKLILICLERAAIRGL